MSGFVPMLAGEHFRVEVVIDGSPAAEAGLQIGDLITHMDGQRAADVDLAEWRQSFRQMRHTYNLRIRRGDAQHRITLALRRLI